LQSKAAKDKILDLPSSLHSPDYGAGINFGNFNTDTAFNQLKGTGNDWYCEQCPLIDTVPGVGKHHSVSLTKTKKEIFLGVKGTWLGSSTETLTAPATGQTTRTLWGDSILCHSMTQNINKRDDSKCDNLEFEIE
jgi:hypothetical protein